VRACLICLPLLLSGAAACRDAAERDLAAAEKAVKRLELAAPKAAQLAAAKREEAADLEARLGQLQVCCHQEIGSIQGLCLTCQCDSLCMCTCMYTYMCVDGEKTCGVRVHVQDKTEVLQENTLLV
jgi:hypothetical protein